MHIHFDCVRTKRVAQVTASACLFCLLPCNKIKQSFFSSFFLTWCLSLYPSLLTNILMMAWHLRNHLLFPVLKVSVRNMSFLTASSTASASFFPELRLAKELNALSRHRGRGAFLRGKLTAKNTSVLLWIMKVRRTQSSCWGARCERKLQLIELM